MKKFFLFLVLPMLFNCSTKDKYDVGRYYELPDQDKILASIITYIFIAPPYVKMEDRFKPEHRNFYASLTPRFSINKYFISDAGVHYFYVVRPGPTKNEKRGVGGHYKMNEMFQLTEFREEFVTPVLPEEEVTGRCAFLFDEMVKGNLKQYEKMETFIQWPNEISYYDSIAYEWKLKPELQ